MEYSQCLIFAILCTLFSVCKAKSCPERIPNGALSLSCTAKVGTRCEYTCDDGYRKTFGDIIITCETSTNWDIDPHDLCTKVVRCPSSIKHGEIAWDCPRQPGSYCTYDCYPWCTAALNVPWLRCGEDGKWSENTDILCEDCRREPRTTTQLGLCPSSIPGGSFSLFCQRTVYSYCEFTCNEDCNKSGVTVYCSPGLYWSEGSCKCQESITSSDSLHTGTNVAAVAGGVIGGIILLVIFIMVVIVKHVSSKGPVGRTQYTRPQPAMHRREAPTRTTENRRIDRLISPTYMMINVNTDNTSLETQQNSEQTSLSELQPTSHYSESSNEQRPPAYITVPELEPLESPPSYEEVISNPTDFNMHIQRD